MTYHQINLFDTEPSTPILRISREWSMPNHNTFQMKPIQNFISRYIRPEMESADPFARNSALAKHTNDLNPNTTAGCHVDAADFLSKFGSETLDLVLFDPPYSPRQISECYQQIGREVTGKDTQNAALYKRVRDAADKALKRGGIVLSFGWNSAGMGRSRGYEMLEILLIAHGGAHNDTICVAERKALQ